MKESRYRVIEITGDLLEGSDGITGLVAILRKLPEDAEIKGMREELGEDCYKIRVWSASYPIVPAGMTTPRESIYLTRIDVEQARRFLRGGPGKSPGECSCDMEYTGLRQHKSNCPKRA